MVWAVNLAGMYCGSQWQGEIPAVARYGNGGWAIEFSRNLVTGSDKDVQFSDQ
ncbi:MAG: hypothetical protein FJY95_22915 [Candidatus Handelsmanbacteria bacterium]|nr:hypothetical protein [Candidatus Handelsmanbacteria bacterium]